MASTCAASTTYLFELSRNLSAKRRLNYNIVETLQIGEQKAIECRCVQDQSRNVFEKALNPAAYSRGKYSHAE